MKAFALSLIMASANLVSSATIQYVAEPIPEPGYEIVTAEVFAYSSSVDETDEDPFIMASGKHVYDGALACPSRLEFGTEVEIDGVMYVCEDRMNRRYRDKEVYDIWRQSKEDAYAWGRREISIKVYK
jgi:3D (Asp-Asp-Asp) domain-containing protein